MPTILARSLYGPPAYALIDSSRALIFCGLFVWNYTSNYPDKKIEDTRNYGFYNYPWVGEKYQPGGQGTSLYKVDVRNDGIYYNKRINFFVMLFGKLLFLITPMYILNRRVSKYKINYINNSHTITVSPKAHSLRLANRAEKIITVGDYKTTKEIYLKLKNYIKEASFISSGSIKPEEINEIL